MMMAFSNAWWKNSTTEIFSFWVTVWTMRWSVRMTHDIWTEQLQASILRWVVHLTLFLLLISVYSSFIRYQRVSFMQTFFFFLWIQWPAASLPTYRFDSISFPSLRLSMFACIYSSLHSQYAYTLAPLSTFHSQRFFTVCLISPLLNQRISQFTRNGTVDTVHVAIPRAQSMHIRSFRSFNFVFYSDSLMWSLEQIAKWNVDVLIVQMRNFNFGTVSNFPKQLEWIKQRETKYLKNWWIQFNCCWPTWLTDAS